MNLKNKTDKELWDMLDNPKMTNYQRYDIHKEIIRREKEK